MIERLTGGERRRQRRVVGDPAVHRLSADGIGLEDGLLAFGGVYDQIDLVVLDHVDDVWPPFAYLVDAPAFDAGGCERGGRTAGRDQREAVPDQTPRQLYRAGLVTLTHADEAAALARQHHARGGLRFGIRLAKSSSSAHDLAGGFH